MTNLKRAVPIVVFALLASGGVACGSAPAAAPPPGMALAPPARAAHQPTTTTQPSVTVSTPEKALERFFTSPSLSEDWFAPDFLSHVPIAQLEKVRAQLTSGAGAFRGVRAKGDAWDVELEKAAFTATVRLDDRGRFSTLFLKPAARGGSIEDALAELRALPGKTSALVLTDGVERGSVAADVPLAVGSTFKLAILATLREQVDAKKRGWTDVVKLDAARRSLPSGILQDWPDKTPMTLASLAALMISVSDNTATDAMLELAGRENVEKHGARNVPFLSTSEAFKLKAAGNAALLERWRKGDVAAKRAVLRELAKLPLPKVSEVSGSPSALDVEWYFTARETCALMKKVAELPLMGINPGVASKDDWEKVAYKGGSEPGVINMTTWVEKKGRAHCVSVTWNDEKTLDDTKFGLLVARLLGALEGAKP